MTICGGLLQNEVCYIFGVISSALFVMILLKRKVIFTPNFDRIRWLLLGILTFCIVLQCFIGIDKWDSLRGLGRYFSTVSFCLLWLQLDLHERKVIIEDIPILAVAEVIVCIITCGFEKFQDYFWEFNQMSGTFGYSNTFALFLLCSIIIIHKMEIGKHKYAGYVILAVGILLSRSLSVMFLLLLLCLLWKLGRKCIHIVIPCLVGISFILYKQEAMGTVFERLLYYKDALRILIKKPFGIGYQGWYYLQGVAQHGIYHTRFVHNDWLQLAIDYGLFAFISVIFLIAYFIKQKTTITSLSLLIFIHSCFDFDLQFQYILYLFIMFLTMYLYGEERQLQKKHFSLAGFGIFTMILLFAEYIDIAWNTDEATQRMLAKTSLQEAYIDAREILEHNVYVASAWRIMGEYLYICLNFDEMCTSMRQYVSLEKYNQESYNVYSEMLNDAYKDGMDIDDFTDEMDWMRHLQRIVVEETDILAKKLKEKVSLTMDVM